MESVAWPLSVEGLTIADVEAAVVDVELETFGMVLPNADVVEVTELNEVDFRPEAEAAEEDPRFPGINADDELVAPTEVQAGLTPVAEVDKVGVEEPKILIFEDSVAGVELIPVEAEEVRGFVLVDGIVN